LYSLGNRSGQKIGIFREKKFLLLRCHSKTDWNIGTAMGSLEAY